MKHAAAVLFVITTALTVASDARSMEKSALLLLPLTIESQRDLRPTVEFRWDEDTPVEIWTVAVEGRLCTHGELKVYSADGKEMPMFYPMTMPLIPSGSKTLKKGDVLRIGIYTLSFVQRLKPGSYYAIATFSDAFSGKQNVRFKSKRRWFQVTGAIATSA
jgi:hypothetical protein